MNSQEFYLWLQGYLEALETEGIESCKIERILKKMEDVNQNNKSQEKIVYGPNINPPAYAKPLSRNPQ